MLPFISICILSYNRPEGIIRLLNTIDLKESIEIIISDDCSPRIFEIENKILKFNKTNKFNLKFYKNSQNQGYDKNLNKLIKKANGEWIIFMGDDDEFVSGALEKIQIYLKKK